MTTITMMLKSNISDKPQHQLLSVPCITLFSVRSIYYLLHCTIYRREVKSTDITDASRQLPNFLLECNPWRCITIVNKNFVDVVRHRINIRIVM